MRMSSGDPQEKICLQIRLPGFAFAGCERFVDTIRFSGRNGATETVGSSAKGAKRFLWPLKAFQDSAVMKSSSGELSAVVEVSDKIAVSATRGLETFDRLCSEISFGRKESTDWNAQIPSHEPLPFNLFPCAFRAV